MELRPQQRGVAAAGERPEREIGEHLGGRSSPAARPVAARRSRSVRGDLIEVSRVLKLLGQDPDRLDSREVVEQRLADAALRKLEALAGQRRDRVRERLAVDAGLLVCKVTLIRRDCGSERSEHSGEHRVGVGRLSGDRPRAWPVEIGS